MAINIEIPCSIVGVKPLLFLLSLPSETSTFPPSCVEEQTLFFPGHAEFWSPLSHISPSGLFPRLKIFKPIHSFSSPTIMMTFFKVLPVLLHPFWYKGQDCIQQFNMWTDYRFTQWAQQSSTKKVHTEVFRYVEKELSDQIQPYWPQGTMCFSLSRALHFTTTSEGSTDTLLN